MKILMLNDYLRLYGGTERFIYNLADSLREKGHSVEMFGSEGGEDFPSLFSRWYSKKWQRKVKKKIEWFKPDIVHVNNCIRVLSPSVLKTISEAEIPMIMTLHDPHYLYSWGNGMRSLIKNIRLFFHRKIILENIFTFTACSEFLANKISKSIGWTVTPIHNGVDIPIKATKYKKKILFVGEINQNKGLHIIAKTLNKSDYQVNILGEGYMKEELEKKYINLNFKSFTNPKPYYKIASILVMPSIWDEPFGLSVTEAMSYGLCVIGSNVGGIPEQVKHMETGLLFRLGDEEDFSKKLNYLMENPSEIKRLGSNARKAARKKFNSKNVADKYLNIYKNEITQ